MGKQLPQRERILILERLFEEETDERHPIRLEEILTRLACLGLPTERKSIYRDMKALQKYGLDIAYRAGLEGGWYLKSRHLGNGDLRAVLDALAVYPWLSEDQRADLTDKLLALAPRPQRKGLRRPVTLCRRTVAQADQVRTTLDRIYAALQSQRSLTFLPVEYNGAGERTTEDGRRMISPKGILWTGENYRLLAWDHREQNLRLFRPDRMEEILATGMPAQGPETDASLWAGLAFGPGPERRERVRFRCHRTLAGEVLDCFGPDCQLTPEGDHFYFTADVAVGAEFWGWMSAHGELADVIAPPWAAKTWREKYRGRESRPKAV